MYFQDIHTNEILKLKGEWQKVNDQMMAYFQTELGALITMCESDLRKIYTIHEIKQKHSDDREADRIYNMQKKLAKRGARLEMFLIEAENSHLYHWKKEYEKECIVTDFDIESETVTIKDYPFPIPFKLIHDVYHLDLDRFVVDEVVEVIHRLGFDHVNMCIEHSERITMNESLLKRTVFIHDNKTRTNIFEIANAEILDDTELYTILITKIKEFSSKAILNI
jgi:hypothetical protein